MISDFLFFPYKLIWWHVVRCLFCAVSSGLAFLMNHNILAKEKRLKLFTLEKRFSFLMLLVCGYLCIYIFIYVYFCGCKPVNIPNALKLLRNKKMLLFSKFYHKLFPTQTLLMCPINEVIKVKFFKCEHWIKRTLKKVRQKKRKAWITRICVVFVYFVFLSLSLSI